MKIRVFLVFALTVFFFFPFAGNSTVTVKQANVIKIPATETLEPDVQKNMSNYGEWYLRDGTYFSNSSTLSIVFKVDTNLIRGFAYSDKPNATFCFWGKINANGNLSAQRIIVQEIHFVDPWIIDGETTANLDEAMISMRIVLSSANIMSEFVAEKSTRPETKKSMNDLWVALSACD